MAFTNFKSVLRREWSRFKSDPFQLIWFTVAFIFCHIFFLTFFHEGIPQKLPVAVVDKDGTYLSRRFIQEINNTQGVSVIAVYNTHKEAREAMQKQEIYAFIEIPDGAYNEVLSFRSPNIAVYSNYTYLLGGTLSYKSLLTMANLASGAVQREILRKKGLKDDEIMGLIQPIEVDARQIGNPWTSYQPYLLTTILPGLLGMFVLMFTIFSIGSELKGFTAREWMQTADNNIVTALCGKLIPYQILFIVFGIVSNLFLFGFMKFPFNGSFAMIMVTTVVYVLAMSMLGIFLTGVLPVYRDAMSLGAFYGILAFSLSGFTYPVTGMYPAVQSMSFLFPLRYYYLIYVNEALFAGGAAHSIPYLFYLLLFCLLPFIVLPRLKNACVLQNYPVK